MAQVPHPGVDEQESSLEDVKEPLMPHDRAEILNALVRTNGKLHGRETKVLHSAINAAHGNQAHTGIQSQQRAGDLAGADEGSGAASLERNGQQAEQADDDDLDYEGGFHQDMSNVAGGFSRVWTGDVRYTKCVHYLDDGGQGAEGGEDAARVHGGKVRDVVEDATENVVIG